MRKHARSAFLSLRARWWFWVATGVSFGLVCVGVRVRAMDMGGKMTALIARRNELIGRVQTAQAALSEVRQYEQMEKRASSLGFVKLGQQQIVMVPQREGVGLLARLFGSRQAPPPPVVVVPPRDEPAAARSAPRKHAAHPAKRPRRK
jgi:hypothetical protein